MFLYRLGRFLQVLALIDVAFALFFANSLLEGMEPQLQILVLAAVLFLAGRFFQKRGEVALRAKGLIPPEPPTGGDAGEAGREASSAGRGSESP